MSLTFLTHDIPNRKGCLDIIVGASGSVTKLVSVPDFVTLISRGSDVVLLSELILTDVLSGSRFSYYSEVIKRNLLELIRSLLADMGQSRFNKAVHIVHVITHVVEEGMVP